MDSHLLRRTFLDFFAAREHVVVPSASLIPHDQSILFTVAGMVPFKPYFLGEEMAPFSRAVSIQKCMRAGGKHNDLDQIGKTSRHLTFFEMMGNFSFGDYFKEGAIPFAWKLVTEVLGLDPERLWVTVHLSDDEAEEIWLDTAGIPRERIQRLDEDNWWQMGETGPCGPCSEIYYDKGPEYGAEGGPAFGSDERFLEIWNLVFMQYDRQADGSLTPLPRPCIDTGAGLERIVPILQNHQSVFETDLVYPILEEAQSLTGVSYGRDSAKDIGLRIMADHARSATFLMADGVIPTNDGRGYVLRRIIRRLIMRGRLLGGNRPMMEPLVTTVVKVMSESYPEVGAAKANIVELAMREEDRFNATLVLGSGILEEAIAAGNVSGAVAFKLHDTLGFPIELTTEIAADRGVPVDLGAFTAEMEQQRERARSAGLGSTTTRGDTSTALSVLENHGKNEFTGYESTEDEGRLVALVEDGGLSAYLDRTPFYPEGGGQVGDTGIITGDGFRLVIGDTDQPVPGVIRHRVTTVDGVPRIGSLVHLQVDGERRERIRANHTATHLLHWALREVLGTHVKQQGSLVAPDRLRFDFSHWRPLEPEEIARVEELIFCEIISDAPVVTEVEEKESALSRGAMAFFGDRYQDVVRVVRAGHNSLELCGGTHLDRLGRIGLLKIVSESSIGANTRRVEALTQIGALKFVHRNFELIAGVERIFPGGREKLLERIEVAHERTKTLEAEIKRLRAVEMARRAEELSRTAVRNSVVTRIDGLSSSELRELALALKRYDGVERAVLAGGYQGKAVLVGMVRNPQVESASEMIKPIAQAIGGGVGPQRELAISGGRDLSKLDSALDNLLSGIQG